MKDRKKPGPKMKPKEQLASIRISHYHTEAAIAVVGGRDKATEIAKAAIEKYNPKL